MLVLKLTLVPLFLFGVSMAGRRWGPSVAGWLAALPVVTGPILFLLVLAHGPVFGARAATLALSAILASESFNFAYAWTCRARPWPVALTVAMLTWTVVAYGLSFLPDSPAWAAVVALAAVCFGQSFLPRSTVAAASPGLSRRDLVGRMLAGALLTLFVTTLSTRLGPTWSGLFAVFPLLGSVLSVASHRAHGPDYVISLLRGMVLGRFSFAAFCLFLSFALLHVPVYAAFLAAVALALLVQSATKRLATARMVRPAATD